MKVRFLMTIAAFAICLSAHGQAPAPVLLDSDTARNIPAPAFVMKDLHGRTVALADFRGKVLVIDFWATWCVNCHETLPFMKTVINKYKDDQQVCFLFVDTRERSTDRLTLVKNAVAKHGYPSDKIVIDEDATNGKHEKYYRAFNAAGLPTRFVVDGNGVVRFESIGFPYGRTNDELATVLIGMVEAARKPLIKQ